MSSSTQGKSSRHGQRHASSNLATSRVRVFNRQAGRLLLSNSCIGSAQHMTSDPHGALETLHSLTPWLNSQLQSSTNSPQFIYWSEKLLAEAASLAGEEASRDIAAADAQTIATALGFFRLWASHPQVKLVALPQGMNTNSATEPISRSPIWRSYYNLLSYILQQGLPYSPPASGPERPQLASEIRRVESLCEASVLRETKFPAANSSSPEIEAWVEQVIQNWEVLCGSNWTDEELGEGGQNAVGRNVLDVCSQTQWRIRRSGKPENHC